MSRSEKGITRRKFLQAAGVAGIGTALTGAQRNAQALETLASNENRSGRVPVRPFGKSGIAVSILSLGGMFNIARNQLMLKQAVKWGVTYWDTADCYRYGPGSEQGFGMYFKKNPEDRKKVFLVTKSDARDPDGMSRLLDRSLERLNTSYVDLYLVHGISSIDEIDDDTRNWAQKAKSEGKIRLFGFSTHSNMESCMIDAAKGGWIDGIMMTYNYRLMHNDDMKRAVEKCARAGIGLTAMKTQGGGSVRTHSERERKLAGRFLEKGFTDEQAKLMAVWENPHIASICSQMPSMAILKANAAAAMNKTQLSGMDKKHLRRYAVETASGYCAGCSQNCEALFDGDVPIRDVMRYLMYSRSYGEHDRAVARYQQLLPSTRKRMQQLDFAEAEKRCPQKMAIGRLMREAAEELVKV